MQKKILIVDYTTHHPEVVGSLLTLFGSHRTQLAVTESFRTKFLQPGGDPSLNGAAQTFVRRKDDSEREWLERLAPVVADQDVVIFSTPLKSGLLARTLALPGACRRVLFVHNVNYFLDRDALDLATFARLRGKSPLRAWPAWWLERRKARRNARRQKSERADFAALNPRVDAYCFGSDSIADYFRAQSGQANTLLLPTNTGISTSAEPEYRGRLHVAIIGMVSQQRKDYRAVFGALIAADLRRPLVLSVLGSCADPALASELAALARGNTNPNLEIRFDPDRPYIPAEQLRALLADVHVLLSPIQPDTEFKFHREVYGRSKVSGAEGDSLAHGRPLLLPRSYACASYIEPLVVPYGDMRELVAVLDGLNDAAALQARYARLREVVDANLHARFAERFLEACTE